MSEHELAPAQRPDSQLVRVLWLPRGAVDVAPPAALDLNDAVHFGALGQAVEPFDLFLREFRHVLLEVPEDLGSVDRRFTHPPLTVTADPGRRAVELADR